MTYPAPTRASYAVDAAQSRGRLFAEAASPTRTAFQRDRDRIVHCTAVRRLAHKTQVFVYHADDHFRTRLTHTIEVSQIARALSRSLGLDDDLAEAIALGHDLGHTPFGHIGEDALDACMAPYGGFDHNSHGLRLVTELERRYADFDGLNLSQETLEGLVKHNGPLIDAAGQPLERWSAHGVPAAILAYDRRQSLELASFASLEAQAAAIADDIAYNAHDIDDGLRAGLISLQDLAGVPFIGALLDEIEALRPGLEPQRRAYELTRRIITRFIEDAIATTQAGIAAQNIVTPADVRAAGTQLVKFSPAMGAAERDIKRFLFARMYRHPEVNRVREKADSMLRALFGAYLDHPGSMPKEWAALAERADPARAVSDYIAGMTDRFALGEYRRLFDPHANLR